MVVIVCEVSSQHLYMPLWLGMKSKVASGTCTWCVGSLCLLWWTRNIYWEQVEGGRRKCTTNLFLLLHCDVSRVLNKLVWCITHSIMQPNCKGSLSCRCVYFTGYRLLNSESDTLDGLSSNVDYHPQCMLLVCCVTLLIALVSPRLCISASGIVRELLLRLPLLLFSMRQSEPRCQWRQCLPQNIVINGTEWEQEKERPRHLTVLDPILTVDTLCRIFLTHAAARSHWHNACFSSQRATLLSYSAI